MTITFPNFIQFEKENGLNGQTLTMTDVQIEPYSGFTKELKINKYVFGKEYGEGNRVDEENGDRILKIENQEIKIDMQGINVADPSGNGSLNITPTITAPSSLTST